MQYEQAPFRNRQPRVNLSAKPTRNHEATLRLAPSTLHARPDAEERLSSLLFAVGGVVITLSLIGAIWAANRQQPESRLLSLNPGERMATPMAAIAPTPPAGRRDVPQNGVTGGVPHTSTWRPATVPLAWSDLTLMLRTGLTDDEVIAASVGKQLTTVIGPEEVRQLRELGAGNRLINSLQGRTVYNVPAAAPAATFGTPVRQVTTPATSRVSIATPYPVVDYAMRDRQIADLKRRIDSLDESIRVARSDWSWSGTARDAYIEGLDKARNDLRRQKWQLEGR